MCRATRRLVSSPRLPSPRRLYSSPKETPTTPDCARKTPLHPERYYPHARIRVFHHSGPEIPGSAREGKPRSFFLCFSIFLSKRIVPRLRCAPLDVVGNHCFVNSVQESGSDFVELY